MGLARDVEAKKPFLFIGYQPQYTGLLGVLGYITYTTSIINSLGPYVGFVPCSVPTLLIPGRGVRGFGPCAIAGRHRRSTASLQRDARRTEAEKEDNPKPLNPTL